MTEVVVLQQSPSHFPSASSSSSSSSTQACAQNDGQNSNALITNSHIVEENQQEEDQESCGTSTTERKSRERERERERDQEDQVPVLELLLAAFRRSLIGPCSITEGRNFSSSSLSSRMEIGWPSNVRHVAHVTFDRFNGFLGLPVEFEPEVPRRPPSASANVFGVSTESMQLSFDSRGNSVPTILLMMQRHLYAHGGLQAEGIFRINAENSQEEYVRDQLNGGVIPNGVDVHCLAGLIKAWFRELPTGLLDSISPEEVMQSQSEEECTRLVRLLPPTEAALLDWAINLMADVAQMEHLNKMNARNVAMVFAPNMTQMADPLTALMYAVQVMNFLRTLIVKTLRDRQDSVVETSPEVRLGPSDEDGHQSASQTCPEEAYNEETDMENENNNKSNNNVFVTEESGIEYSPCHSTQDGSSTITGEPSPSFLSSIENILINENCPRESAPQDGFRHQVGELQRATLRGKTEQSSASSSGKRVSKKAGVGSAEKGKKAGILGRINSRKELVEAWR